MYDLLQKQQDLAILPQTEHVFRNTKVPVVLLNINKEKFKISVSKYERLRPLHNIFEMSKSGMI
jgi:hypothetical protein